MAWRNVWRNPRRTAIVVTAVAVGISGALLAMAVNYGMAVQMVETAIRTELGHVQIHAVGYDANPELKVRIGDGGRELEKILAATPGVLAYARRVRGDGLVSSTRASVGVRIVGVEPEREAAVSTIARSITTGSYLGAEKRRVIIGERLAKRLHVGIGDKIVISATDLGGEIAGEGVRVGGLFKTPSAPLDSGTVFLPLADSQKLLSLEDAISEVVVVGRRNDRADELRAALGIAVANHEVRSWKEIEPVLDFLVSLFDEMGLVLYGLVFVAMLFGIANVLLMAVYERVREIGILMAIGMSRKRVAASVVLESMIVTAIGLVVGYAITLAAMAGLGDGIDLSVFGEGLESLGVGQTIVPVLRASDFTIPTAVAAATAAVASGWPAYRATKFRPADAVRHV
jgi:ABC-type lipoprotein release transport system permease subunit